MRTNTDTLFLVTTVDVYSAHSDVFDRSPRTWGEATRALEHVAQALRERDLPATIFTTPEAAKRLRRTLASLEEAGNEIGLLAHPPDIGYRDVLAGYKLEGQKNVVREFLEMWSKNFGRQPECFRAGLFSTNDDTYLILVELGFRHGSVKLPGRFEITMKSDWKGAYPFPHHIDPLDRLQPGSIEFYEVPVSSEYDRDPINADYTPRHLDLTDEEFSEYGPTLIEKLCRAMADDAKADVRALVAWVPGASYATSRARVLQRNLDVLLQEAERNAKAHGMRVQPVTIAQLHDAADALI